MSVTEYDLASINEAIASGERIIRKADGSYIEFRSIDDLIKARNELLAQMNVTDKRSKRILFYHGGRGFR